MRKEEVRLETIRIIGVKTRTTNADEAKGAGRIQNLWNRFYSEQLFAKIPGRIDHEVVAVYHDYESDANGLYSLLVGVKVEQGAEPPSGMEVLNVPMQKYARFTTMKGEMPGIVLAAWNEIWNFTSKAELSRRYTYDFEVYGERASNPASAEVDLYIAIE